MTPRFGQRAREERWNDAVEMLKSDSRVQLAARYGERFGCDPVVLLRDWSETTVMMRQAVYEISVEDERKRNEAEKAAARKR